MRKCRVLIVLFALLAVAACSGKGIEVGNPPPKPLEGFSLEMNTAGYGKFVLTMGEDGEGLLEWYGLDDELLDSKTVYMSSEASMESELTETLSDGEETIEITIRVEFDSSAEPIEESIALSINGINVNISEITLDRDITDSGDDSEDKGSTPKAAVSFKSISTGSSHTCAIDENNTPWCWGNNSVSQSTPPDASGNIFEDVLFPAKNDDTSAAGGVSTGDNYTCIIRTGSQVYCWGGFYDSGIVIPGFSSLTDIASDKMTCVNDGGVAKCFVPEGEITTIQGVHGVKRIDTHGATTCAITHDSSENISKVACWGINYQVYYPGHESIGIADSIAVGNNFVCVSDENNIVSCSGDNDKGQLGNGTVEVNQAAPKPIASSVKLSSIKAGHAHVCGSDVNGQLWCWGDNTENQLGLPHAGTYSTPKMIESVPAELKTLDAGNYHYCAITADDAVICWGLNSDGQLGDGTTKSRAKPKKISSRSDS